MIRIVANNHVDIDEVRENLDFIKEETSDKLIFEGVPIDEWQDIEKRLRSDFEEADADQSYEEKFEELMVHGRKWNGLPEDLGFDGDRVIYLDEDRGLEFTYNRESILDWIDDRYGVEKAAVCEKPSDARTLVLWGVHAYDSEEQLDLFFGEEPDITVQESVEYLPDKLDEEIGDIKGDVAKFYSKWEDVARDTVSEDINELQHKRENYWLTKVDQNISDEDAFAVIGATHVSVYGDNFRSKLEEEGYGLENFRL